MTGSSSIAAVLLVPTLLCGCQDQAPPVLGGVYALTTVNGVGLPVENTAAATLTLARDHQFTRLERDTAGLVYIETGSWGASGPIEVERVFLDFTVDGVDVRWHATSPRGAHSLSLQRNARVEAYRRQ